MQTLNKNVGFLVSEIEDAGTRAARFFIIPCPLEKHVSYGGGTADGPAAILRASQELEAYYRGNEPCQKGIHTTPAIDCTGTAEEVLSRLAAVCSTARAVGAMPIVLGGEHTVTWGALRAWADSDTSVGVVQLDAHADLRDTYDETPFSHACVMRRAQEMGMPVAQFGVRSLSREEHEYRHTNAVHYLDAERLMRCGIPDKILPDDFPQKIYITLDLDVFDSSLMPATGTPEPGGLDWYTVCDILDACAIDREIVGCDVVELAPMPGFHAADYLAAKCVYHIMSLA